MLCYLESLSQPSAATSTSLPAPLLRKPVFSVSRPGLPLPPPLSPCAHLSPLSTRRPPAYCSCSLARLLHLYLLLRLPACRIIFLGLCVHLCFRRLRSHHRCFYACPAPQSAFPSPPPPPPPCLLSQAAPDPVLRRDACNDHTLGTTTSLFALWSTLWRHTSLLPLRKHSARICR